MLLGRYLKTPTERKRYSLDYSQWLEAGETVTQVTFEVILTNEFVVDSAVILPDAKSIAFFVNLGLDGITYSLIVNIMTSAGQVKQDQMFFTVKGLT